MSLSPLTNSGNFGTVSAPEATLMKLFEFSIFDSNGALDFWPKDSLTEDGKENVSDGTLSTLL